MCQSHTCNKSALQWSTETCQDIQKTFPTCRCKDWAPSRKSYGSGAGAGGFGDKGDFRAGGESAAAAPAAAPGAAPAS